jgi:quercetin dioxygenase-like cupin family protein
MTASNTQPLRIELKNRGERLELSRIKTANGTEELHMKGSLLAHREGPPPHIHLAEDEFAEVVSGTASIKVDGKQLTLKPGQRIHFPIGTLHTYTNDADEELIFRTVATPVVDLDRYLQAIFQVLDAGPPNRPPPIFYMAHVMHRHRRTQLTPIIPRAIQRVLLPVLVGLGTILGKYRGDNWPGCPTRCTGAPLVPFQDA